MSNRNSESGSSSLDWDVTDTGQPYTQATFVVTEGTWMNLDVSPDGKTLMFDMLGDIYSIPTTGGDAKLIHGGPAMENKPRFSPDGSKIVYVSDRNGSDNLWISNIDGSEPRQISRETVSLLSGPAWTPDGRYLAATKVYAVMEKIMSSEIWLYHLTGGDGRLVVETPANGKSVQEPQFSHDGRYLYYTENVGPASAFLFVNPNLPNFAVKRRSLNDGTTEEVVCGFGSATTPHVSPNDKRIAFIRRVKEKTVLFVYNAETGEQRPVYDGLDRDLFSPWYPRAGGFYPHYSWFPDSRHLAIWAKGKILKIDTESRAREEIPFRVTAEHRLTIVPRFENELVPESFTVRAIQQIALAPDGDSVAFNALGHLWCKPLPDGLPERLTNSGDFEFEPAYSPDGRSIAYVSWDDERGSALELFGRKSGTVQRLLEGVGNIRQPAFSMDGKSVVYWLEGGNKKGGGYRAKEGLYWISLADGKTHFLGSTGKNPLFSPDGGRVYFESGTAGDFMTQAACTLESVNLDGLDRRVHVKSQSAREFRLSPDASWLAFKTDLQYHVVPYLETGTALVVTKTSEEMPRVRLSEIGGYELTWSADSRRIGWVVGESLFQTSIDEQFLARTTPAVTEEHVGLQARTDKPEGVIAFVNGRIITMLDDQVFERGSLVVRGNQIVAIGPSDQLELPQEATVIDVTGKTLMPGFVDMHGHIEIGDESPLMPQKHPNHYAAVAFGVTTNFDPSAQDLISFAIGEMQRSGVSVGPRFITTGRIVDGREWDFYTPIFGLEDARKTLARKKALGAIIVKSYMQPMRSQRQQLIKAGREAEVMVTPEGEGNFFNNISMILDGHVSVEHNFPLANFYDDIIQLMAHGKTSTTPVLVATCGDTWAENYFYQTTRPWDDPKIKTYVQKTMSIFHPLGGISDAPPYVRGMTSIHQAEELWDVGFRSVARSLKKLDEAGVTVNAGGHGQINGLALHWEMWALSQGGMSNHRVLRTATANGAKTLGLDKQIGTLEAGKLADLIVLDENPLEDIRHTNSVRYTMVNGRLYDSFTMNEIGNYIRPRSKFYWELDDYAGIDWNEAWGGASHSGVASPSCCGPTGRT